MHIALHRIHAVALAALITGAGNAAAQPADDVASPPPDSRQAAPPPVRPVAPPRVGRRMAEEPPATQAADPVQTCFEAARDVTAHRLARRGDEAAYTCDLAVQIAREPTDGAGRPDRAILVATLANRSLVLAGAGRLQPALADLDEALGLEPGNAVLHGNRGNLLLRLNRPVDALDAHDQAIALAPRDPAGYVNRAFSHRALGNAVAASEDVARARALGTTGAVRRTGIGAGDDDRGR